MAPMVVEPHLCVERWDHFIRHQDRHDDVNEPQRNEQRCGRVLGTNIPPEHSPAVPERERERKREKCVLLQKQVYHRFRGNTCVSVHDIS